jgi:hypothetical protein
MSRFSHLSEFIFLKPFCFVSATTCRHLVSLCGTWIPVRWNFRTFYKEGRNRGGIELSYRPWDEEKLITLFLNICPEACCRKRDGGGVITPEKPEGWPLLTVETEGEWALKEYLQMKGSFLGRFVGLVVPVQETFILPWMLLSAQYKTLFSLPYIMSIYVPPLPSNLGRSPCRAACLWMCVSGNAFPTSPYYIFLSIRGYFIRRRNRDSPPRCFLRGERIRIWSDYIYASS